MPITLRSIAEKETSEVIQIIRQEEAHVDRMASAGIDFKLSMLVESGQLPVKAEARRVPPGVGVADGGKRHADVGDIFRIELHSCDSERAEPGTDLPVKGG
jgi:hypothetical protein